MRLRAGRELGDVSPCGASDFWNHPKVTKRWPGDGQVGFGRSPRPPMALPPDPPYEGRRPCVGRTLQNLLRLTLPVGVGNLDRFTGDTLYPHHDDLQNLILMRLTTVARRGRSERTAPFRRFRHPYAIVAREARFHPIEVLRSSRIYERQRAGEDQPIWFSPAPTARDQLA